MTFEIKAHNIAIKLSNSISGHLSFELFLGRMPPDPLASIYYPMHAD